MQDADLEVKQYTLEALSQIVSNKYLYQLLRTNVEEIIGKALNETPIRQDLIEIVDLGPFKHTNDKGAPIRKAAFTLLQAISQFFQFNQSGVIETAIGGFSDTSEDVQLLCLGFMSKLLQVSPMIVMAQLDKIVEQFSTIYSKMQNDLKKGARTERQLNLMRGILRVCWALQRNPEAMENPNF